MAARHVSHYQRLLRNAPLRLLTCRTEICTSRCFDVRLKERTVDFFMTVADKRVDRGSTLRKVGARINW